ncbi:Matrixin [Planctomycetes bacterium MalM25]|nr:Matrixin [Planctomycetes bacterium MalM25]
MCPPSHSEPLHRLSERPPRPLNRRLAAGCLLAWIALTGAPREADAFVPAGTDAEDSRWQSTSAGSTGDEGDPITLTWSFIPDGTQVRRPENTLLQDPSDLIAEFDAAFGAGPGGADLTLRPWFTYFEQSFDRMSELMGVTYVYEPNDNSQDHGVGSGISGFRGDVRIGGIGMDGSGGTLAYNYFPSGGGDMALDTDDLASFFTDSTNNYRVLRNTIMHEAGHGLGLEHSSSGNADFLMEAAINESFDGPQHDDLRGFHWLYGDALEKGGRNETAATATDLGALAVGGSLSIGAGGTGASIGMNETDFVSIANEDDDDYFAFTIAEPVRLDATMTPRGASYLQGAAAFDTTSTNDLFLTIYDTDGTTLLIEEAIGPAGVAETVTDFALDTAGTYYARVRSVTLAFGQVVQFYQLDLSAQSLIPELLGDFNSDGVVDAGDYTVWRDTLGSLVSAYTGADHNGDGQVNSADYTLWRDNFGATLGAAVAVPEPAAAVPVALLLLGIASHPIRLTRPIG